MNDAVRKLSTDSGVLRRISGCRQPAGYDLLELAFDNGSLRLACDADTDEIVVTVQATSSGDELPDVLEDVTTDRCAARSLRQRGRCRTISATSTPTKSDALTWRHESGPAASSRLLRRRSPWPESGSNRQVSFRNTGAVDNPTARVVGAVFVRGVACLRRYETIKEERCARIATFEGEVRGADYDEQIDEIRSGVESGNRPPGLEDAKGVLILSGGGRQAARRRPLRRRGGHAPR